MPRRPPELEAAIALQAGGSNRFPVQEHVGTQREVVLQARGPRNDQTILERQGYEAADGRVALPDEDNPGPCAERCEHGAKEFRSVDGRAEVAHADDERVVEGRQTLGAAELDRESRPLRLADLIPDALVELTPELIGTGWQRERQVDLVLRRRSGNLKLLRAAELHRPGSEGSCIRDQALDEDLGNCGR